MAGFLNCDLRDGQPIQGTMIVPCQALHHGGDSPIDPGRVGSLRGNTLRNRNCPGGTESVRLPMNMTEDLRREARGFLAYSRLWLRNVKALSR